MEVNGQLSFWQFENIYSSIYAKLNKENEKGGKAYEDAAILTTNVLLHQDQGINVIITIVKNKSDSSVKEFKKRLENPRVKIVYENNGEVTESILT